jgi:hypothetical protein
MADFKADGKWNVEKNETIHVEEVEQSSTKSLTPTDPETPKPKQAPVETDLQLVTSVLRVEDDPSINPWTFRMWFLGMLFCFK